MGVIHCSLCHPHHGFIMMRCFINIDTKKFGELRGGNNNGCSVGEPINNRMGEKVDHHSQPEYTKRELEDTDNQGQDDGIGDKFRGTGSCQRFKRGRRHQGDNSNRTSAELTTGTEQGCHHGRQKCGIQTIVGRKTGQLGIGHGLGN